jgi:hypothetical protein
MGGNKSLERFRMYKRRIAWQNDGKLRPAKSAARDLHRMSGAVLRLLQRRLRAKGLNHGRDLLRLMPHHHNRLLRAQRRACSEDMFD